MLLGLSLTSNRESMRDIWYRSFCHFLYLLQQLGLLSGMISDICRGVCLVRICFENFLNLLFILGWLFQPLWVLLVEGFFYYLRLGNLWALDFIFLHVFFLLVHLLSLWRVELIYFVLNEPSFWRETMFLLLNSLLLWRLDCLSIRVVQFVA